MVLVSVYLFVCVLIQFLLGMDGWDGEWDPPPPKGLHPPSPSPSPDLTGPKQSCQICQIKCSAGRGQQFRNTWNVKWINTPMSTDYIVYYIVNIIQGDNTPLQLSGTPSMRPRIRSFWIGQRGREAELTLVCRFCHLPCILSSWNCMLCHAHRC